MAAESPRFVILIGLEVTDEATYARYRTAMLPILEEHGGAFGWDFAVAKVLRGRGAERVNRVFTMTFPERASRLRFVADERYRAVRAELFEPAVGTVVTLEELERSATSSAAP